MSKIIILVLTSMLLIGCDASSVETVDKPTVTPADGGAKPGQTEYDEKPEEVPAKVEVEEEEPETPTEEEVLLNVVDMTGSWNYNASVTGGVCGGESISGEFKVTRVGSKVKTFTSIGKAYGVVDNKCETVEVTDRKFPGFIGLDVKGTLTDYITTYQLEADKYSMKLPEIVRFDKDELIINFIFNDEVSMLTHVSRKK